MARVILAHKRGLSDKHLVNQASQRPEINLVVVTKLGEDLRGKILRGACDGLSLFLVVQYL